MFRSRSVVRNGGIVALLTAATVIAQTPARKFRPVTDQMVANPSPNDWLSWRGTSKSLGYSGLDQVNRGTVGKLQAVWAWAMEPGAQEAAPIVHDGIMYLGNAGGIVQALDGETGDLLWEYKPTVSPGERPSQGTLRGIAIYEDKIFVNTPDGR